MVLVNNNHRRPSAAFFLFNVNFIVFGMGGWTSWKVVVGAIFPFSIRSSSIHQYSSHRHLKVLTPVYIYPVTRGWEWTFLFLIFFLWDDDRPEPVICPNIPVLILSPQHWIFFQARLFGKQQVQHLWYGWTPGRRCSRIMSSAFFSSLWFLIGADNIRLFFGVESQERGKKKHLGLWSVWYLYWIIQRSIQGKRYFFFFLKEKVWVY